MSGPGNPNPSFSFGSAGTTGESNPFGQASNTSQGGTLFGSTSNPPASSSLGLFGSGSAAPTSNSSSGGGNASQTSTLFGSSSGGSGAASGSVFGGTSKPQQTGFSFGTSSNQPSASAAATSDIFGKAPGTSGQQTQAGTSTPAKPTFSFGNASTTPAGPPPSSGGVFGGLNKPQEQKTTLFGSIGNSSGASQNTSSSAANPPTMFAPSAASTANPASQPASSNLFGGVTQSSNPFGGSKPAGNASTPNAAQSSEGLFGALNTSKPETSKPQAPSLFSSPAPPADTSKPSVFQNLGTQSSAPGSSGTAAPSIFSAPASTSSSSAPKSTFSFPSAPSSQPVASSINTTTATSAPSLFNNLGSQSSPSATSSTPASAPSGGLFKLGNPVGSSTSTAPAANSTSTAPAATSSLFGAAKAPTAQASSQPTSTKPADSSTSANLGASTSGPHPPAQSRLKNKSMDEIITRWASDLSKHTKEFHEQASKVSQWDLMLVENSDKIQKLYGDTLEAERATTEVERQLTAVENDQNELGLWLDHYEGEVNKMMSASQMTGGASGETLMGPDKERDRTYRLAERLSGRLEEMGMDLGAMIEEINDASKSLNKTSRADDPVSLLSIIVFLCVQIMLIEFLAVTSRQSPQWTFNTTPGYRPRSCGAAEQNCGCSAGGQSRDGKVEWV